MHKADLAGNDRICLNCFVFVVFVVLVFFVVFFFLGVWGVKMSVHCSFFNCRAPNRK